MTFIHKKELNVYIVYEVKLLSFNIGKNFVLKCPCLEQVCGLILISINNLAMVLNFLQLSMVKFFCYQISDAEMSLPPHIDNKKKDILILGKRPTDK